MSDSTSARPSTRQRAAIQLNCDVLNSDVILADSEPWADFAAVQLKELIVPENGPSAGPTILPLFHFIKKKNCKMILDHQAKWLGMNMLESTFNCQFNDSWLSELHPFFSIETNFTLLQSRGGGENQKLIQAILKNIKGEDPFLENGFDA